METQVSSSGPEIEDIIVSYKLVQSYT